MGVRLLGLGGGVRGTLTCGWVWGWVVVRRLGFDGGVRRTWTCGGISSKVVVGLVARLLALGEGLRHTSICDEIVSHLGGRRTNLEEPVEALRCNSTCGAICAFFLCRLQALREGRVLVVVFQCTVSGQSPHQKTITYSVKVGRLVSYSLALGCLCCFPPGPLKAPLTSRRKADSFL